jgi:hypothetical protein
MQTQHLYLLLSDNNHEHQKTVEEVRFKYDVSIEMSDSFISIPDMIYACCLYSMHPVGTYFLCQFLIFTVAGQFVAGQFVADNSSHGQFVAGQFVARQFVAWTIRRRTIRCRTIRCMND